MFKMASKFQSTVAFGEEMLTCSICFENFRDPKVLPCLHTFCRVCVERHYAIYKLSNRGKLSCPVCRALLPLPINGVQGFRDDILMKQVKHIIKSMPSINWLVCRPHAKASDGSTSSLHGLGSSADVVNAMRHDTGNTGSVVCSGRTLDDEEKCTNRKVNDPLLLDEAAGGFVVDRAMDEECADPPEIVKKRIAVRKENNALQATIAYIRSKMLELYHFEDYIRFIIQKEVSEKNGQPTSKKQKKKLHKQVVKEVENLYGPTLAALIKEQDLFYQKVMKMKSIYDVTEEVLGRSSSQIGCVFDYLMGIIQCVKPIVESVKSEDDILKNLKIPEKLVDDVRQDIKEAQDKGTLTVSVPHDPRKMGVQLLFKISGYGKQPGKFDFPTNATFLPNSDVLVSDKNNFRLQQFNQKGELQKELFTGTIKPRRAKMNPVNGNLYVSDEQSESVKVFSPEGVLLNRIGEGFLLCPAGLDFDSKGNLVMTDPEKNYVTVHDSKSGEMLMKKYFCYMEDKRVPNPYFVAVNDEDQFIVTDKRNNQVKVFDCTGRLLFKINDLDCPRGVCLDPYGNILIAEGDKHCVSMYSPHGKFLQTLIDREPFGLCYPLSLDMDKHGRLVVTQCGYLSPHEVLVFQVM